MYQSLEWQNPIGTWNSSELGRVTALRNTAGSIKQLSKNCLGYFATLMATTRIELHSTCSEKSWLVLTIRHTILRFRRFCSAQSLNSLHNRAARVARASSSKN